MSRLKEKIRKIEKEREGGIYFTHTNFIAYPKDKE